MDLNLMVENMVRKTDIVGGKLSQLMLVYQAIQKIQDNQQQKTSKQGMEYCLSTFQVEYQISVASRKSLHPVPLSHATEPYPWRRRLEVRRGVGRP
jgi:hypothetical protein